jgi:hypothetical protein
VLGYSYKHRGIERTYDLETQFFCVVYLNLLYCLSDEEEIDSSNIDGVFQIVNEIWDDPVRKYPGDEPSIKT